MTEAGFSVLAIVSAHNERLTLGTGQGSDNSKEALRLCAVLGSTHLEGYGRGHRRGIPKRIAYNLMTTEATACEPGQLLQTRASRSRRTRAER